MNKLKTQTDYPEFCSEVETLSADELKARIVQLQRALEDSENHKDNNEDLKSARSEVSELSAPYRDVKTAVKLKTKYIIELLQEKGE